MFWNHAALNELEAPEYNLQREQWSWRPLDVLGLLFALDVDFFWITISTTAEQIFTVLMRGSVWGT